MIKKVLKKIYYQTLGRSAVIDRFFRYRNAHDYWTKRGGDLYFSEQESVESRTLRSEYVAEQLRKYDLESLLEIGCGYGKQLKNIYQAYGGMIRLGGCDFSASQIGKMKEYFSEMHPKVKEADASELPYDDASFNLVFSSAVILHNKYEKAQRIVSEMIRVSNKYIAHNEDVDITFSRYGYDFRKTYEMMNFKIHQSGSIPCANQPEITQFTVVEIPNANFCVDPKDVPLQYN